MKRSHIYCGASSWRDLKTMTLDSLAISSSMVFQPSLLISDCPGVSKLLPVTIRAARFCNFCNVRDPGYKNKVSETCSPCLSSPSFS